MRRINRGGLNASHGTLTGIRGKRSGRLYAPYPVIRPIPYPHKAPGQKQDILPHTVERYSSPIQALCLQSATLLAQVRDTALNAYLWLSCGLYRKRARIAHKRKPRTMAGQSIGLWGGINPASLLAVLLMRGVLLLRVLAQLRAVLFCDVLRGYARRAILSVLRRIL